MKINLVAWAHDFAREHFPEKCAFAVDATAGNGNDTLFLAKLVGENGRVAAFDVQEEAIAATRKRLEQNRIFNADLFLRGHEKMAQTLPENWRGNIGAVFFNLGYLPRSNHAITTSASTTLPALNAAWEWLAPDGFISLTIYTRHSGGFDESLQVNAWLETMRSRAKIFTRGEHNPAEPWWAGIAKTQA